MQSRASMTGITRSVYNVGYGQNNKERLRKAILQVGSVLPPDTSSNAAVGTSTTNSVQPMPARERIARDPRTTEDGDTEARFLSASRVPSEEDRWRQQYQVFCIGSEKRLSVFATRGANRDWDGTREGGMRMEYSSLESRRWRSSARDFGRGQARSFSTIGMRTLPQRQTALQCSMLQTAPSKSITLQPAPMPPLMGPSIGNSAMGMDATRGITSTAWHQPWMWQGIGSASGN